LPCFTLKRLSVKQGKRPWFILLKYRRGGFTTLEQALSYMTVVSQPRSYAVTLAHTQNNTQRIFRIVSGLHQEDPKAMRLVSDSKQELEFSNGSLFFIGTAGGKGAFRGDTLQRVHGSEVAKWCPGPHQAELVDELASGFFGAASNGEIVLESTPNGREWFYQTYMEAKQGLNEFTPIFLPWFSDPINRLYDFDADEIRDTLAADEKALTEKHGVDLGQLAWRREQKRIYKRYLIQEMPEDDTSCFLTSGVCFFDVELLLTLLEQMPEREAHGSWQHHAGGYEVRWKPPFAGRRYVVGVDTSEGLKDCDLNGIGVLDKETGEQVASLHGRFNPKLLAEHCVRICSDYNGALLGIERENHGHAVLQRVIEMKYSKPHFRGGPLYYYLKTENVSKSRPGWTTSSLTRPVMLNGLADAIHEGAMTINDRDFVDELLSFRLQGNGKFEADGGAHDDTVMKWAIAWQMREQRMQRPHITVARRTAAQIHEANVGNGNGGDEIQVTVSDYQGGNGNGR